MLVLCLLTASLHVFFPYRLLAISQFLCTDCRRDTRDTMIHYDTGKQRATVSTNCVQKLGETWKHFQSESEWE